MAVGAWGPVVASVVAGTCQAVAVAAVVVASLVVVVLPQPNFGFWPGHAENSQQ